MIVVEIPEELAPKIEKALKTIELTPDKLSKLEELIDSINEQQHLD